MIEAEHLTKRFGAFTALSDLSFSANSGEILGFLGPNGAGKTTTMRILTGYMPPSEGVARVAGFDVVNESLKVREQVGYFPETVPLYPDMSVRGYVRYMADLHGVRQAAERVNTVLRIVGMYERRDKLIRSISKGMRQRVGLAQALVHDPEVLILDEPTIGLDPHQTLEFRDLVRALGRSHTILFSTHILSEAEQVCDRVIIIDRGKLIAMDAPQSLRDRLQRSGRLFVRVGPSSDREAVREALAQVTAVSSVTPYADGFTVTASAGADVRARLAEAVVLAGWELLELRPLAMSLEDIFLELTARIEAHEAGLNRPADQVTKRSKRRA